MSSSWKKLKKKVNYESTVPRCGNCVHIQHSHMIKTVDQGLVYAQAICGKHGFGVKTVGVCDTWQGKEGEVLE